MMRSSRSTIYLLNRKARADQADAVLRDSHARTSYATILRLCVLEGVEPGPEELEREAFICACRSLV